MNQSPHVQKSPDAGGDGCQLRMTRYERVSAALTSLLIMLGMVTTLMLLVWLSRTIRFDRPPVQVSMAGPALPQPQLRSGGLGEDLQAPAPAELASVGEPPLQLALDSIAPLVESQVVSLEVLSIESGQEGDGRKKGSKGPGSDGFGPFSGRESWERWEIRYSATDLDEYKRQLDFFAIEFGVAGGGNPLVYYLKGFSSPRPAIRTGQAKDEKRIRFQYVEGPLLLADREISQAAGVEIEGRVVYQFHTQEMYDTLLKLENDHMRPRRISDVVRTVFGVRRTAGGYEFFVLRQDYRTPVKPSPPSVT